VKLSIALRGYDRAQVDELLARAEHALASRQETLRATARQALRSAELRRRMRGYSRHQVERLFEQRLRDLSRAA
jgi:DivIVA domain-containing protein